MKHSSTPLPTAPLATQTNQVGTEIDFLALLQTIWRGKWLIMLVTFIALLLGGYYAFFMTTPLYRSTATVVLQKQQANVLAMPSVMEGLGGESEDVNTEVEVIRSRELLGKLVDDRKLLEDPEFNAVLRPPPKFAPIRWVKKQMNIPMIPPTADEIYTETVDALRRNIGVSNLRQSLVFNISVTSEQPGKSARLANRLSELYIQDQLEVKRAATEEASVWLSGRVAELKQELESAEAKANAFNSETSLISPESLFLLNTQMKEMRERIAEARTALTQIENEKKKLDIAKESGDPALIAEASGDLSLQALLSNPVDFQDALKQFEIRQSLDLLRAQQQVTSLEASQVALEEKIAAQTEEMIQLNQLQREAEANRLLFEGLLTRLKETSVQRGLHNPDSRILSYAVARNNAVSPRKGMILALSLILGGFIGTAYVLAREMAQNTIRTNDELNSLTGLNVFGSIPTIRGKERTDIINYVQEKPTSVVAEAVRNLRTSILMSNPDFSPQMLLLTSSVPGEGKTTASLTLAQNMAGLGKKVLVMDADIRRRTFTEYFDTEDRPGFISVISGAAPLEKAVWKHDRMGVDILMSEASSVNAADIFSSKRFESFLQDLRKKYDYVVLDAPPVLAVPDARVIAPHTDATIYVVKWDETTKTQIKQGLSMLHTVGVRVAGLVLSQVDSKKMRGYGYYGQYGYDAEGGYYDS